MKWLIPLLAGMALAIGAWLIWSWLSVEPIRVRPEAEETAADPFALEERAVGEAGEEAMPPGMPEWMIGSVIPGAPASGRMNGLPDVVGRVEMLTRGRSKAGANTIRLKLALAELRESILAMTPEEAARLAKYFEDCDDATTKYYLLIIFRQCAGEPFVACVRDYYEAEPDMVGETLSYMVTRTPRAVAAFADLIREEFDPLRRARLVSRAGFTCNAAVEPLMVDLFERSGASPERRIALWGLARTETEEGRRRIRELLDGPPERAHYAIGETREDEPELDDLRAHGVLALLMTGTQEDRRNLLARARARDGDIGRYVDRFFAVVRDSSFVPDVVDLLESRGEIEDRFLIYLNNQALPEHRSRLERLLDLARDESQRDAIRQIIDRLN